MLVYIDASFLLSIIFEEISSETSISIWKDNTYRVSSILLIFECLVTLRRFYKNNKNELEADWLLYKEKELADFFEEVNTRQLDNAITEYIRIKRDLSECRTLDAIHMATALEFKDNISPDIKICTYDQRMRKLAQKMGFSVLPVEN